MCLDTFMPPHVTAIIAFAIDSIKSEAIPHYVFTGVAFLWAKYRLGWREFVMLAGMLNIVAATIAAGVHYWEGRDITPAVVWFVTSGLLMLLIDSVQKDSLVRRTLR